METESSHSNQSSYLTGTKNIFIEANARNMYVTSASLSKQFLRRRFLKIFLEHLPFSGPQQPIKISDQDEGHLKHSALLNKHFSKNKIQISPMRLQK